MSDWVHEQALEYVRLANAGDNRLLKEYVKDRPDAWKTMISEELKRIGMWEHVPIKRLRVEATR